MISRHLPVVVKYGGDLEARGAMLLASCLAGGDEDIPGSGLSGILYDLLHVERGNYPAVGKGRYFQCGGQSRSECCTGTCSCRRRNRTWQSDMILGNGIETLRPDGRVIEAPI